MTDEDFNRLGDAFDRFEAAIRVAASGARFDVQIGDVVIRWSKEGGEWRLTVSTGGGPMIPIRDASLGVRLMVALHGAEAVVAAAWTAADAQRDRLYDAIEALDRASELLGRDTRVSREVRR